MDNNVKGKQGTKKAGKEDFRDPRLIRIGENVAKLRESKKGENGKKLTQVEFYDIAFNGSELKMAKGSKSNTIRKIEHGEQISLKQLLDISSAFHVPLESLVSLKQEKPSAKKALTVREMISSFYKLLRVTGAKVENDNKDGSINVVFKENFGIDVIPLVNFSFTKRDESNKPYKYNYTSWKTCQFLAEYRALNNGLKAYDGSPFSYKLSDPDSKNYQDYRIVYNAHKKAMDHFISSLPALTPKDASDKEDKDFTYDKEYTFQKSIPKVNHGL